ncbi:MAG: hypothetical protein IKG44_08460 [Mogibacterium sp.]|nr:hypothetical protein [Mogibacterium sp.]
MAITLKRSKASASHCQFLLTVYFTFLPFFEKVHLMQDFGRFLFDKTANISIITVMKNSRLIHEANETLRDLQRKRIRMARQLDSLSRYKGWNLKKESKKRSGLTYYDVLRKGSDRKTYLGGESHEQVLDIKRLRYAAKALTVFDHDIDLLESLIRDYIDPDYSTINSLLPATYQTDMQLQTNSDAGMPQEAIEWKRRLEEEKAKYPPYKPDQLKHPALDGTMMRSKSEVIIANILLLAGIPFVYEAPLFINGKLVLPDFIILSLIDLKTEIIIEHQGMVFVDEYADKFIRSLKVYLQSDWIPNKTLFFTFDNARETIDPEQVLSILQKHVNPSI